MQSLYFTDVTSLEVSQHLNAEGTLKPFWVTDVTITHGQEQFEIKLYSAGDAATPITTPTPLHDTAARLALDRLITRLRGSDTIHNDLKKLTDRTIIALSLALEEAALSDPTPELLDDMATYFEAMSSTQQPHAAPVD